MNNIKVFVPRGTMVCLPDDGVNEVLFRIWRKKAKALLTPH